MLYNIGVTYACPALVLFEGVFLEEFKVLLVIDFMVLKTSPYKIQNLTG
jgi:hypothetical protein